MPETGFDFVHTDIVLGEDVTRGMESVKNAERYLVVLAPSVEAIVEREVQRAWSADPRAYQE